MSMKSARYNPYATAGVAKTVTCPACGSTIKKHKKGCKLA